MKETLQTRSGQRRNEKRKHNSDGINYHEEMKTQKRTRCMNVLFLAFINYELSCEDFSLLLCVLSLRFFGNRFSILIINSRKGEKNERLKKRSCKTAIQYVIN